MHPVQQQQPPQQQQQEQQPQTTDSRYVEHLEFWPHIVGQRVVEGTIFVL